MKSFAMNTFQLAYIIKQDKKLSLLMFNLMPQGTQKFYVKIAPGFFRILWHCQNMCSFKNSVFIDKFPYKNCHSSIYKSSAKMINNLCSRWMYCLFIINTHTTFENMCKIIDITITCYDTEKKTVDPVEQEFRKFSVRNKIA